MVALKLGWMLLALARLEGSRNAVVALKRRPKAATRANHQEAGTPWWH